jgi:hypothetical protein
LKLLFVLCFLAAASSATAQVYKCPDSTGKLQFQQTPCVGSAGSKVEVRPASGPDPTKAAVSPAAAPGSGGEKKSFTDTLADERMQRERWVKLNDAKLDADRQRVACEEQQRAMASRTASSNNNLAGATRNQAIASEMQAAATTCQNRVSGADRLVDRLQAECDRQGCRAPGT